MNTVYSYGMIPSSKNLLHHVSTALIKNHDLVVAEELRSKNMLRNHALAISISDVG
ncbi:hypothetical protein [Levilactobacillus fuyuanensis]